MDGMDGWMSSTASRSEPPLWKRWIVTARSVSGIVPALVIVALFFLLPVAILLWRSVSEPELGFAHYIDLLRDSTATTIIIRTFVVAFTVTGTCMLLAYPYAYLMTRAGPRLRTLLLAVVLVSFLSSLLAKSFAWIIILQPSGLLNNIIGVFGLPPTTLLGTQAGVTIGMIQVLLPFGIMPLYATMVGIDRNLLVAARSLGARPIVAFSRIFLPLSIPGLAAGSLLVFILSLGFYITPDLLGSPSNSLLSQLITVYVRTLLDFPGGGALSAVLLAITLIVLGFVSTLVGRLKLGSGESDG